MNQEASFTFTTPLNVNVVMIKGVEHTFVEGDISTNDIDLVNDIMTKECQESMQKQIMERNMKLDIEHEAFKGKTHEEKEINKTKIPAGKLIDATVKDLGEGRYSTRVKGEINPHDKDRYKQIKGYLKDSYLDAFSVAFLPVETKTEERDGEVVQLLNDVKLLNVALTGNPCNTKAQIVQVATKAIDAVEEYKKMKELDPSLGDKIMVKSADKKQNPLSYVWDKISMGEVLDKKSLKLLKAAIDVADVKGTESILIKEYMTKLESGMKLTWKEYYIFRELLQIEYQEENMVAEAPLSKSSGLSGRKADLVGNKKVNNRNSKKMTETKEEIAKKEEAAAVEAENAETENAETENANESEGVEQKSLKEVALNLKALSDKYDKVDKDTTDLKEAMGTVSKALEKITIALSKPIHKSPGAEKENAANGENSEETKSVDPLDAFK